MPDDRVLFDEWHLQLFIAPSTPDPAVDAIRRTLDRKAFRRRLRRAIRRTFRRFPRLKALTVTITC
jgi:hypothetical protein